MRRKPLVAWLGQGGVAVRATDGTRILIDPYFSNACYRYSHNLRRLPPPLDPAAVEADVVAITHEHRDHCDPGWLPGFARTHAAIVAAPQACVERCVRDYGMPAAVFRSLAVGEAVCAGSVRVMAVPAVHSVAAVGYVVQVDGWQVYVSGDTVWDPILLSGALPPPDVAFVVVNGVDGNMGPQDAATFVSQVGAKVAIPMHYGLFSADTTPAAEFLWHLDHPAGATRGMILAVGTAYSLMEANHGNRHPTDEGHPATSESAGGAGPLRLVPIGPLMAHW